MNPRDLQILHDCILRDLRYDVGSPDARTLSLVLECPPDLGKAEWDGKTLLVRASDVVLFRLTAWGHCWGNDSLDAWDPGVSDATRAEISRLPAPLPPVLCTARFQSGSWFELACQALTVHVLEGTPSIPAPLQGTS